MSPRRSKRLKFRVSEFSLDADLVDEEEEGASALEDAEEFNESQEELELEDPDDDLPNSDGSADERANAESDSEQPETDLETTMNGLALKVDHNLRPIVASENGKLFLEAFSPIAEQAQDFLAAVAEPVSRPRLIHEYILTEYSLYAAVSVGIQTDSIIQVLNKLCKTDLPPKLVEFIRLNTKSYGKVKLVLKDNRQYVESAHPDVLRQILQSQVIREARVVLEAMQNTDADGCEATSDEFTTRIQTFEPVTFARPALVPANGRRVSADASTSSSAQKPQNIAYTSALSATKQAEPIEKDYVDLFADDENDLFDSMDDPLGDIDPEELEKLNRILDGQAPEPAPKKYDWKTGLEEEEPAVDHDARNNPMGIDLPPNIPLGDLDKTPEDILNLDLRAITDPSLATINGSNLQQQQHQQQSVLISSFEIDKLKSESVRKACSDSGFPILEEYEFRNDATLPVLDISLRPAAVLRPYQEKSLNKMFGNGRARSGIIVLPCGAGKTLVGVTAACTVKKRVLVLCTSAVSVEQWAREFRSWTNVADNAVAKFTSVHKELLAKDNGILVSTYTMVSFSGKRAYDAQKMMDYITSREWGLLILDEVHVVPAEMFRKVLTVVGAHCKLGLTATLVREDDKIANLNYLIGPKLYEANWMDLAKKGHIANVRCQEVWCTMTKEFYKEYLSHSNRKRQLLYVMNPNKIQACQYLIDYHEARGDKVIVFSDNVFALKHYATKLNRPYIYGGSSTADRLRTLQQFKYNPTLNTIFLSKVGDTSIDIPEASCLIQISSHYGSRRQEAQRLGRILRAKKNAGEGYNSFFYTLVSRDTEEVFYCSKRQQFLIDQGYSYDIVTSMEGFETVAPLVYRTINERLELLATILVSNNMVNLDEIEEIEDEDLRVLMDEGAVGVEKRISQSNATMRSLSGADNMAYIETARGGLSSEFKRRRRA